MKLRYSPTSPYVRKVMVLAKEAGLDRKIEAVTTNTTDPALWGENPLGKVPAFVTDDGTVLFDSPVILEYLDSLHAGAKFIPPSGPQRWKALTLEALADGILDAALLRRGESLRPQANQSAEFFAKQGQVIERSLDVLEKDVASLNGPLTVGIITVGCALGYLDFRFAADAWRKGRPKLAAWYEAFSKRPSMASTAPPS
ncbi:MAG: glutathione S-transferase N-terminal domain-containing protein [Alphaproteobacteria bacterium]